MILPFQAPAECHVIRDSATAARSTFARAGNSSSLYFWKKVQEYAESKCHALRDTFRIGDVAEMRAEHAVVTFDSPEWCGSPPDAA